MKKFLSFLLTFVMLFSLTMPAMAAEVTGNTDNPTEGEVSATWNPEIAFTGIVVVDENSDEYRYDETSKTYTIIIPADEVGGTGFLSYDIIGTNLTLIEDTNTLLKVQHENEDGLTSAPDDLLVDVLQDNGYFGWSVLGYGDGEWEKLLYSNDGGMTWTTYTFEVKQAYSITVNASQNGTVTANEYAIEGETVTLNVSPAEGYMLDTLSVTDASGNTIVVENNQFTMPASAVTVNATFAVCDHKDSRHETATDNDDGTHNKTCACGDEVNESHTFDANNKCSCGAVRVSIVQASVNGYTFVDGWSNEELIDSRGTEDEGQTAWENEDQIFVTLTSKAYGAQTAVLTFNGSVWSTDVSFFYLENETPIVTAIYAPCYELVDGELKLKDGMQLGMTEYIVGKCEIENGTINISFEGVIREYSRLRIVGLPNQTLTVITTEFIPAGIYEEATEPYTLTTDEKGNAYLYGTFPEGATVSVKKGEVTLSNYYFNADIYPGGTEQNVSYALEARPIIDGTLGGKTEATEDDLAAMVELLKSYIENGHTTIIVTGSQPAKLLMSGYLTPIVSLAFEQLTYVYQDEKNDSYWGTVDLIYQDVTEIVEYEFYCCDVLKSITLPKVTTVGDRGFWACYYLETLTFGSVVTDITDDSGEVFYDLGYKIGGCNLVLDCGQMNTETEYQPDLENDTWWENEEWKSITLTHTGECDECKANQ